MQQTIIFSLFIFRLQQWTWNHVNQTDRLLNKTNFCARSTIQFIVPVDHTLFKGYREDICGRRVPQFVATRGYIWKFKISRQSGHYSNKFKILRQQPRVSCNESYLYSTCKYTTYMLKLVDIIKGNVVDIIIWSN